MELCFEAISSSYCISQSRIYLPTPNNADKNVCLCAWLCSTSWRFLSPCFRARCLKILSNRTSLGGISLLLLFVYKYIADTSFILVSCVATGDVSALCVCVCMRAWVICVSLCVACVCVWCLVGLCVCVRMCACTYVREGVLPSSPLQGYRFFYNGETLCRRADFLPFHIMSLLLLIPVGLLPILVGLVPYKFSAVSNSSVAV